MTYSKTHGAKKFRMLVRINDTGAENWEEYTKETQDPKRWAKDCIEYFNTTCRPGESRRTLVKVELVEDGIAPLEHDWSKTNLVTLSQGGRIFDDMKCQRCGVTGKRFGFGTVPKRNGIYRPVVYARCDTALAFMAAKEERALDNGRKAKGK